MKSKILILIALVIALQPMVLGQKFKFSKVGRDTKKEAKKYEKDGYRVFAGKPPIEQQLNTSFANQAKTDDMGFPVWIIGNGTSVSQSEAAGLSQAMDFAKINLLGMLETNMSTVVESNLANNQLSKDDAESITKTIQVSTNKVSKKLGPVNPLFGIVREVGKNYETKVMLAYNYEMVRRMILAEMKVEFEKETEDVRKKYEDYLNPVTYNVGEIVNYQEVATKRE